MRVISTDYRQTALLYFCHELENAASCLQGSEGVVILNRDGVTRDHWRVNALVDLVPPGCFRHDDFEWMNVNTGDDDYDNETKILICQMLMLLMVMMMMMMIHVRATVLRLFTLHHRRHNVHMLSTCTYMYMCICLAPPF